MREENRTSEVRLLCRGPHSAGLKTFQTSPKGCEEVLCRFTQYEGKQPWQGGDFPRMRLCPSALLSGCANPSISLNTGNLTKSFVATKHRIHIFS